MRQALPTLVRPRQLPLETNSTCFRMLHAQRVSPSAEPGAVALRTMLCPTVASQGGVEVVLAELQAIEAAEDYDNPRYMELLIPHHYEHHVLRRPYAQWPDSVLRAFEHLNPKVYIPMQGPSELGARGKLAQWDRRADLSRIEVPTLTIGAAHDTMDPQQMAAMAKALPRGSHLHCPNGSHMAMVDDQVVYIQGLIDFLRRVDAQTIREDP